LVGAELDAESLGVGVPLPVGDPVGDGLGDQLGDGEVVGLGLGEPLGLGEAEILTVGDVVLQLGEPVADPGAVDPGALGRLESVSDVLDGAGCPLDGPLWLSVLELLAVMMTAGSAAIANEAAATTNRPVAIAAAGRSQPSQANRPARAGSGRNLSTMTPNAYLSQSATGSRRRSIGQSRTGTAVHQLGSSPGRLAEILARIRSRPSAAGSTELAASRSAFRSTFSSAV